MILAKNHQDTLKKTVQALQSGSAVIIPTDTVYGFSGIVPETDSLIRRIKGRAETKPFIQLIAAPEDIHRYTDDNIPSDLLAYWPGPLTIIVNNKCTGSTTAFRCPGDEWLRSVIRQCGAPLYSSSVNRSGCPLLTHVADMETEFGNEVACIVDDGDLPENALPSTIVSVASGSVQVIRQGAISIQ